ncbi:MAG: uracil-DNA glycosylase family protein [Puniceicoccales bacterium]|nr:uracil-DNA glycosylase family protein [Puniceicoccales bacterium]
MTHFKYPFATIFNEKSEILILRSFSSVASREQNFYYAYPQNRFWKIIAHLTKTNLISTDVEGKKFMLLSHKITLMDVIQSCNIEESSDNRITHVRPVNLSSLPGNASLNHIFINEHKAFQLYSQYLSQNVSLPVDKLHRLVPQMRPVALKN